MQYGRNQIHDASSVDSGGKKPAVPHRGHSFDEACAVVETNMGQLTVEGQRLHIQKSDVETGDLVMDGQVNALSYKPLKKGGDGLLTRLLK